MSATSAGDLDLRVLMIGTLVSGLILGMLTEQCWALTDDLKFQISAFIAQSYLQLTNQAACLFLPYSLWPRIWSWPLQQDFCSAKTGLLIIIVTSDIRNQMQTRVMQNQSCLFSPRSKPISDVYGTEGISRRVVTKQKQRNQNQWSEVRRYKTGLDRIGIQNKGCRIQYH